MSQAQKDNRANQLNPNNDEYKGAHADQHNPTSKEFKGPHDKECVLEKTPDQKTADEKSNASNPNFPEK